MDAEKKNAEEKGVIVRQYGCLEPLNWDQSISEHLYLQNKFWNTLVEIEKNLRTKYREVFDSDAEITPLLEQSENIKSEIERLDNERKKIRVKIKKKTGPETEYFDNAISNLKEQRKNIAATLKEKRKSLKEVYAPQLQKIEDERKALIKEARQNSGLWWGNYNAVADSFNTARVRAMKTNAELKFHRFDGSGRFTMQIQGGVDAPDLFNSKRSDVFIQLMAKEEFAASINRGHKQGAIITNNKQRQQGILYFTIYTSKDENRQLIRHYLKIPVIFHRPIPEQAKIKLITLKRKRIATNYEWSVTFTATTTDPSNEKQYNSGLTCAINFGWKNTKEGMRVATIQGNDNNIYHINLPERTIERLNHTKELQSRIDIMTNENFEWFFTVSKDLDMPDTLKEAFNKLKRAKKPHPDLFARFVIEWRKQFRDINPELLKHAETRRKNCKRVELEMKNLKDKTLKDRLNFYKIEAKKIAERYSIIILEKMKISELAKLEKEDGSPTELSDKARSQRQSAAVSTLREWIILMAEKHSSKVEILTTKSTTICHKCGSAVERQASVICKCDKCGASWDQDENAVAVLLRAVA